MDTGLCVHIITVIIIHIITCADANWFYLAMVGSSGGGPPASRCSYDRVLVDQQIAICRNNPESIHCVTEGIVGGIKQCQQQFKYERWNCTTTENQDIFAGNILARGSRESAFIHAMTSASVVHSVVEACSAGNLSTCSCDMRRHGTTHKEGWKWGGCSDNIHYGIKFGREFVDAPDSGFTTKNARSLMNLHNNEAGRQAIKNQMRVKCRCHGVSGSCAVKSCWNSMPSLKEVGDYLKHKYDHSIKVGQQPRENKKKKRTKALRRGKVRFIRSNSITKHDLVHLNTSPNYCERDPKRGILGTTGRQCNRTSTGSDGCETLCCGRGYNTEVIRKVDRCHCRFVWCCHVQCQMCETVIDKHTCK